MTPGAPQPQAHLVGIAGTGMNALAQVMLAQGWRLSGSDRHVDAGEDLPVVGALRAAGVRIVPQDGCGLTADTRVVVVSTAIECDNPDLLAAERQGIPVCHRAAMLATLLRGRETVAITGTAGKTTVTGMVGWILEQLGADPTVVNGGIVLNWAGADRVGNVRVGGPRGPWVVEADESDRSLLQFHPDWALITNRSADHFSREETEALFERFRQQVRRRVIVGWDPQMPWHNLEPVCGPDGVRFVFQGVEFRLGLLGRHNAENALQAAVLCAAMGQALPRIAAALAEFRGIRRRLERVGTAAGVTVLDDYAHNPVKVGAAWSAVAAHHGRVLGVWRPHGFRPLAQMFADLVEAFGRVMRPQDQLYLLPVYYAGGTAERNADSDRLAAALADRGLAVAWVADHAAAQQRILERARPGDAVLIMGARDPHLEGLARAVLAALQRGPAR